MKEKERERESLKKKERKFKDTKKYAVGLSNLLGNVARRELTSWEEKSGGAPAPVLITSVATGANNLIIRSRSNPDRSFRLRRRLEHEMVPTPRRGIPIFVEAA